MKLFKIFRSNSEDKTPKRNNLSNLDINRCVIQFAESVHIIRTSVRVDTVVGRIEMVEKLLEDLSKHYYNNNVNYAKVVSESLSKEFFYRPIDMKINLSLIETAYIICPVVSKDLFQNFCDYSLTNAIYREIINRTERIEKYKKNATKKKHYIELRENLFPYTNQLKTKELKTLTMRHFVDLQLKIDAL